VVELVAGALYAEVVPQHSANEIVEAFVVEAGGARVAVHGTVFSVVREADRVNVEVTRGTVTVGPSSYRGATTGRLLVSPAHASFDAVSGAFIRELPANVFLAADGSVHEPAHANGSEQPTAALAPTAPPDRASQPPRDAALPGSARGPGSEPPANSDPLAVAPSASVEASLPTELPKLSVSEARAMVMGCLRQSKPSEDTTTVVTVSSHVTAILGVDGEVDAVRFSPPLKPNLQSRCGGALFGRKIAGSGPVSFNVTFSSK
jgi:hypothetical protein